MIPERVFTTGGKRAHYRRSTNEPQYRMTYCGYRINPSGKLNAHEAAQAAMCAQCERAQEREQAGEAS